MTSDQAPEDRGRSLISAPRRTIELTQKLIDLTRARLDDPGVTRASVVPGGATGPPRSAAICVADLVMAGRYLPAGAGGEPIAGDFYDLIQAGPDRLVLVVGDVTGHGASALS